MSDSLRDQLLGLGFKPTPKPQREARPARGKAPAAPPSRGTDKPRPGPGRKPARDRSDIDLAKAYAIRAQKEKDERIEAERLKQEQARLRREARAKLAELLQGKALNDEAAEIARHFEYGGKIKRIYVTAEQLKALNSGELGVVQVNGRYLLVTAPVLAEAEAVFAPAVALKVDPQAPSEPDPYADPKYQVPDDLVW
ncbi:MAG: DUF2058 family protein [Luteimonas sp.]|nr:DUF2058 family protein [Luteimonas sp.]